MTKKLPSAKETNSYDELFDPNLEYEIKDVQRTGEIAAVRTVASPGLGNIASRNLHPAVRQDIEWLKPETGLQKELVGVHLGANVASDGRIYSYKDRSSTPVPEAGIFFVVAQNSLGLTGIDAKPMPGYSVEAAELNPDTGEIRWLKPEDDEGEVSVVTNRGNYMATPFEELATTNMGNPGTQAGIVRVTEPEQGTKYYALGAHFQGEQDNWQVVGGVIEVQPQIAQSLTGPSSELPPADN
jgi:hypothetical protein